MENINSLQLSDLQALKSEASFCEHTINKIEQVKIYAIINHNDKQYTIELVDFFANFPFDWKKEIQILMTDAVTQYSDTIKKHTI